MNIALGFCFWDILALIVLLAVVIGFVIHTVNLNKQEKELEDELSEIYADQTTGRSSN